MSLHTKYHHRIIHSHISGKQYLLYTQCGRIPPTMRQHNATSRQHNATWRQHIPTLRHHTLTLRQHNATLRQHNDLYLGLRALTDTSLLAPCTACTLHSLHLALLAPCTQGTTLHLEFLALKERPCTHASVSPPHVCGCRLMCD